TMLEGHKTITLSVCPTTGGNFELEIGSDDSIEGLRRKIARHLQTPRERLTILFKEKVLSNGTLLDHRIQDGNKITLLPTVESGFSSTVQGTQQSIIQAIESLSDVQVSADIKTGRFAREGLSKQFSAEAKRPRFRNPSDGTDRSVQLFVIDDFLSGRSPLTLALRVGDHMMFVQLQLEQSMVQGGTPPSPHPTSSAGESCNSCKGQVGLQAPIVAPCRTGESPVPNNEPELPLPSSPELASEISSIVHAAKHHSSSESSSYHRRSSTKVPPPHTTISPTVAPPAGACIDSFTTHGPGIFSGTFSGSLHPNIQDTDGRPKRDPQTILQILTDLLSATNHYQQSIPTPPTLPPAIHATSVPQHPLLPPPLTPTRTPSRTTHDVISRPAVNRLKQLLQENNTTRSKLQQLTHMMKQRKLRRKMRREACGPY
uniref:Ubiquitin-like domain-containing protein n=1 Tax=Ciona savignyi TaxID=51511 RepID=H2YCM6_CIOSA